MDKFEFDKIVYRYRPIRKPQNTRHIKAIGFDSEADREGKTFMYCLSDGTILTPDNLLPSLFSRKYRGCHFVVYNLKYEQGAMLQKIESDLLEQLRKTGKTTWGQYRFTTIGYKCFRISSGKNAVTFWDMYSFFNMSLASAARQFTTIQKIDQDVTNYDQKYIHDNWDTIAEYCIRDAEITERLFQVVLQMAGKLGIVPTTFYSIATIGYKYVRENTNYVTVNRYWDNHRGILAAACASYTGGKFEVTTRGKGTFYEYDINSAYPYEIANLVDISNAIVIESRKMPSNAVYGFVYVRVWIPEPMSHSIALKRKGVNIFPIGRFTKWITKEEYEFLLRFPEIDMRVLKAYWLTVRRKRYPYRKIINSLYKIKAEAKITGDTELYHFTKILLNSIYGKFVQLIRKGDKIEASTCWNPIYGAIITANVRIRIAELQNEYQEICAVHTDSVLSTVKLPIKCSSSIGDWDLSVHGIGVIIGSGIYQVGDKIRFRGFPGKISLTDLLNKSPPIIAIPDTRAISWKEAVFHHWGTDLINRFQKIEKKVNINFDTKRLWDDTWKDGEDALNRVIDSEPRVIF